MLHFINAWDIKYLLLEATSTTCLGFPRNFYLRTFVKFTFANRIEAMYERSQLSVKVGPCSTSRLISTLYRAFSLTWLASMQVYWNKRKRLIKKRVQLPRIGLEHQHGRRDVMWLDIAQKPQDMRTRALASVSCIPAFRFSKWRRTNQNLTRHCGRCQAAVLALRIFQHR